METNRKPRIAVVVGTRPNFIKAAAFFRAAQKHPELTFIVIHTGQHFDQNMSDIFFRQMKIPQPDIFLNVIGSSSSQKIGKTIAELKRIFSNGDFSAVLVFGDVNSTLASALAASASNLRLIHVESGLRSNDQRMPEEVNRIITDHLTDLLFTTEPSAETNLLDEGVETSKIKYVGNIMIESLELFKADIASSKILKQLNLSPKEYVVATIHRRENTDDRNILKNILETMRQVNTFKQIVFPMHPGTRQKIEKGGFGEYLKGIIITNPLSYFDFMQLVVQSQGVVTDSGGIQEETTHLGIPCATLRDNTERPITVEFGSNKLFPLSTLNADDVIHHLKSQNFKSRHIPLWDNKVSERIFSHLLAFLSEN